MSNFQRAEIEELTISYCMRLSTAAIPFHERHQLRFAVREMEVSQWISVNVVNDLESRMQNEIAVIELDQPQQNLIRRV